MKMGADLLTFDAGTSSCKAAIFSSDGEIITTGRGFYNVYRTSEGHVEQDPEEILEGIRAALDDIRKRGYNLSSIRAIGISSQMAAHCLVGYDDKPLTPILSWMDQRTRSAVDLFNQEFSQAESKKLIGMDIKMTPAHTVIKLRWLKDHEPDLMSKAKHLVQVKDILIRELTGCWISDMTTLKGMVDQKTGEIIPEMLKFTGCNADILPPAKMPYEEAGKLSTNVKGFEDLTAGIPVVIGWNDMNAAFLGMCGVSDSCIGMDLTGTSEHLGIATNCIPEDFLTDGLNYVPFIGDNEVCYGVTSAGGQAFDWYMKNVYADGINDSYTDLFNKIENEAPDSIGDLLFIPYVEGERNPWIIERGNGMFIGLNGGHTAEDMAIAVMEGVCFELKSIMDRMPMMPETVIVSGGAARNDYWNQMKADVLGIAYERLFTTEAGCNGAAILARSVLEPGRSIGDIASEMIRTVRRFEPRERYRAYYDRKYNRFLDILERFQIEKGRNSK